MNNPSRVSELANWLNAYPFHFNDDKHKAHETCDILADLQHEKLVSARRIEELETRLADTRLVRDAALAEAYQFKVERDEARKDYYELIYCVGVKHPNETRHETAKRYILAAERQDNPPQAAQSPSPERNEGRE